GGDHVADGLTAHPNSPRHARRAAPMLRKWLAALLILLGVDRRLADAAPARAKPRATAPPVGESRIDFNHASRAYHRGRLGAGTVLVERPLKTDLVIGPFLLEKTRT